MNGASAWRACARFLVWGRTERPGVVLLRIGSNVAQDAQLVDVRIIFRIESFQFWVKCFVAGARKTGVAVVDADVRITDLEVGHVIVAGKPRRHLIGNLVGLGLETRTLDETAQRF